jgi:hypothetical protein
VEDRLCAATAAEEERRKAAEEERRKAAVRNCVELLCSEAPWRHRAAASSSTGQPVAADRELIAPAVDAPAADPPAADRELMAPAVDAPAADPPADPPQVDCQGPPFASTLNMKSMCKRARSRSISGKQNSCHIESLRDVCKNIFRHP